MSLAVRVIPCLDVDAGRVVKGVNFENLRDAGDPVELARRYNAAGADEITFLDVTASTSDRATTYDVVTRTAEEVFIPLTVGGGVRTVDPALVFRVVARGGACGAVAGVAAALMMPGRTSTFMPGMASCAPLITIRSLGSSPERITRRPSTSGPVTTGRGVRLPSRCTTVTTLRA